MKIVSVFYCLLHATWTEGAVINVKGFEGGEVSFLCSHRLAKKNNKYLCKDLCKGSEDTLLTVESGRRAESGRITLVDGGDGVFNVTFHQLQLSDTGRYWCAVDRPGFDTYTEVQLTVKEAVVHETTTIIPEPSTTWTYQISNSTQITPGMDTNRPTNISTASNCTNGGEQSISTSTVLYATVGAVAILTIFMLTTCFRKRRENSKPQPQVCSNGTDLQNIEIGEEVRSMKNVPERFSRTHHAKQGPPTSASTAAECSVPHRNYENICYPRGTAESRDSAANVLDEHDVNSRIYIKPLPFPVSERAGDGFLGKHTKKPTAARNATSKPTERQSTSNASACHSTSCSDSTEVRPKSLWFGLDLSGVI